MNIKDRIIKATYNINMKILMPAAAIFSPVLFAEATPSKEVDENTEIRDIIFNDPVYSQIAVALTKGTAFRDMLLDGITFYSGYKLNLLCKDIETFNSSLISTENSYGNLGSMLQELTNSLCNIMLPQSSPPIEENVQLIDCVHYFCGNMTSSSSSFFEIHHHEL